jgi:peptide/nickel transport system permease protein
MQRVPGWVRALARALAGLVVVVWAAATLAFIAVRLVPGDPVDTMLGIHAQVSEAVKDRIRVDLGLDRSPLEQYLGFLARLVTGDLGRSYQLNQPVAEVIGQQLPATLQLTAAAMALAIALALASVLLARGRLARSAASTLELVAVSAPTYWTGLLLLTVFGFGLGWFPVLATDAPAALVLPALTLALPIAAILAQVLREGVLDALGQPFAQTAIARGVGPGRLLGRHALRHGAVGGVAIGGYLVGSLLGGAVLVETVFARPGLGRVALRAILDRDMPVVLGLVVLSALVVATVNVLVDLALRLLDPRIRLGGLR